MQFSYIFVGFLTHVITDHAARRLTQPPRPRDGCRPKVIARPQAGISSDGATTGFRLYGSGMCYSDMVNPVIDIRWGRIGN